YLKINGSGVLHVVQLRGTTRNLPIGYNPYLPIEITIPSAGNYDNREYEVGLINGAYSNPETQTGLHIANAVNKTWHVNPINLASSVTVKVQWPLSEELDNFDRTNSSLSVWYQGFGEWFNQTFAAANGNDPYTKTISNMYFSPYYDLYFGVGSAGSALPVEFTSFEVEYNSFNNSAILNWQTALEENNSYFEIQRSMSGVAGSWEQIGRVEGQGTTLDITDYQFIDSDLESNDLSLKSSRFWTSELGPKTIYYRLKQVDYNGAFDYSEIRTLNFEPSTLNSSPDQFGAFELWPNPCNLNSILKTNQFDNYKIYNAKGAFIKYVENNNIIDISNLQKGVYYIINSEGYTQKLILN
ncbi:MAG: T9SS type A sorting domain-containing protein, partial [Bacteroidia bacterium]